MVDLNKNFTHIQFFNNCHGGILAVLFRKMRKKYSPGDFFQYCRNYLENTYIGKETKSFRKPPRLPLEIWNVCDEMNKEPTTNNQTAQWYRSFTADQPGIQSAGKSFLGLKRRDSFAKLLFKELKERPKLIRSQLNGQEFFKEISHIN